MRISPMRGICGISGALLAAVLLVGCGDSNVRPEPEFGSSVRNMMREQTYDPNALAQQPPVGYVEGIDGEKAAATLKAYREQKAKPGSVMTPVDLMISR